MRGGGGQNYFQLQSAEEAPLVPFLLLRPLTETLPVQALELRPEVPATEARNLKIPQLVCRGVLANCRKGLPRVSCTSATLFCTSATLVCTSLTGFWSMCTKHLLHPLLTTLGNFEVSGLC